MSSFQSGRCLIDEHHMCPRSMHTEFTEIVALCECDCHTHTATTHRVKEKAS